MCEYTNKNEYSNRISNIRPSLKPRAINFYPFFYVSISVSPHSSLCLSLFFISLFLSLFPPISDVVLFVFFSLSLSLSHLVSHLCVLYLNLILFCMRKRASIFLQLFYFKNNCLLLTKFIFLGAIPTVFYIFISYFILRAQAPVFYLLLTYFILCRQAHQYFTTVLESAASSSC